MYIYIYTYLFVAVYSVPVARDMTFEIGCNKTLGRWGIGDPAWSLISDA